MAHNKFTKGLELVGKGLGGAILGGLGADYNDASIRRNYRNARRGAAEAKALGIDKEQRRIQNESLWSQKYSNSRSREELKGLQIQIKKEDAKRKLELFQLEDNLAKKVEQLLSKQTKEQVVVQNSPVSPVQRNYTALRTSLKVMNKNVMETKFLTFNVLQSIKKLERAISEIGAGSGGGSGGGGFSLPNIGRGSSAPRGLGGAGRSLLRGGVIGGAVYGAGSWAIDKALPISEEQKNYHSFGNTLKRLFTWDYGNKPNNRRTTAPLRNNGINRQSGGTVQQGLSPTEAILLELGKRSINRGIGMPSAGGQMFGGGGGGSFTPSNSSGPAAQISRGIRQRNSGSGIPAAGGGGSRGTPTGGAGSRGSNSPAGTLQGPAGILASGSFGAPGWAGNFGQHGLARGGTQAAGGGGNRTPSNLTQREQAVIDLIAKREGSTHPDIIFGDRGNKPGTSKYSHVLGGKKLSDMTINEVITAQRQLTRLTAADGVAGGRGTSAMGSGQFVRGTLIANLKKLGIPESEWGKVKFDQDLQRRVTLQNFRDTVGDPNGDPSKWNRQRLGQQWESFDTNKGKRPLSQEELNSVSNASNARNPNTGGTLRGASTITPTQVGQIGNAQMVSGMEQAYSRNSATKNPESYKGAIFHVTGKQNIEEQAAFQRNTGYGYKYVIDKDGKLHQLAGDADRPNHILGGNHPNRTQRQDLNNRNALGIGFITDGKQPTEAQLAAARQHLPEIYRRHGIPLHNPDGTPNYPMGHGEVQGNDRERNALGPNGTPEGQAMAEPFRNPTFWNSMTNTPAGVNNAPAPGNNIQVARTTHRRAGEAGEFNYATTPEGRQELGNPGQIQMQQNRTRGGLQYSVHGQHAGRINNFVGALERSGYKINDIVGHENRVKEGGSSLSTHAMGTTIDINQRTNPFEPRAAKAKTDMPEKVEKLAWLHRMSWGSRFGDAQHFETMSKGAWKNKLNQLVKENIISKDEADQIYKSGVVSPEISRRVMPEAPVATPTPTSNTPVGSPTSLPTLYSAPQKAIEQNSLRAFMGGNSLGKINRNFTNPNRAMQMPSGLAGTQRGLGQVPYSMLNGYSPLNPNTVVRNPGMGGTPILPSGLTQGYNRGALSMMQQLPPSGLNQTPSPSAWSASPPVPSQLTPRPQQAPPAAPPPSPYGNLPSKPEPPREPQSQSQAKAGFKGLSYVAPDAAYVMPAGYGI